MNQCAYPDCTLERESRSHATLPASPPARPWDTPHHPGLARQGADSFCILHDPNPAKDASGGFTAALRSRLKEQEEDAAVKMVNLEGVVFPGAVDWARRGFPKAVDFAWAHFGGEARFWWATFGGAARFGWATFAGEASFGGATFGGAAGFDGATFGGEASFGGATFGGEARFRGATFGKLADFTRAVFADHARLDATFIGPARFNETIFWTHGAVSFHGATFQGPLRFYRANLPHEEPGCLDFSNVNLEMPAPGDAAFELVDLSRVSFWGTDIGRVRLMGVEWGRPPSWWQPSERLVLYDEQRLDLPPDNPHRLERDKDNFRVVEHLYRQLRVRLEAGKQEVEAGSFYVGEMEMRRRNPGGTWWGPRWVLGLYWHAAHYGEGYLRPFLVYLTLGIFMAFAYQLLGFYAAGRPIQYSLAAAWDLTWDDYWLALRSALTPTQLFGQEFRPLNPLGGMVFLLNSLLNVVLIAITAVAVRRRFKR